MRVRSSRWMPPNWLPLESIRVYTIGVGTVGKAKSPVRKRPDGSFIYDWVEVNIDEGTLQSIAQETGGRYFRATSGDKLREVYEEIDTLEKTRFNVFRYNKRTEEFPLLGWLTLMVIGGRGFYSPRFFEEPPMSNERTYKVFANVTGLVVFELLFWAAIGGVYLLIKTTVPQFELHQPSAWPALLIAPIVLVFFARHYLWKQRRISQSVDLKLSKTLWPNARPRRSIWKFLVWRTALAFWPWACWRPKTGTRLKEVEAKGVDIMIALDVSRSMLAEDLGMSRLDLAKRTIERIVGSLDGDRAGLVVFAGDAYVQAPLTLDLAAVKLFLDAIGPEAMPVQGTAIGAAIEQCVASFDPESQASKVIMILTDGENHEDDALARADEASKLGIKVHAAGMASEAGGPIPEFDRYGRQTGYKEDQNGQPVVSTLDERMLVAMVEAGTGTYVRARSGYVDLSPFLERPRKSGNWKNDQSGLHGLCASVSLVLSHRPGAAVDGRPVAIVVCEEGTCSCRLAAALPLWTGRCPDRDIEKWNQKAMLSKARKRCWTEILLLLIVFLVRLKVGRALPQDNWH